VLARKVPLGYGWARIAPHNLIPEILGTEHGVKNVDSYVGVCVMVAVKIDTTRRLEKAVHLLHPFLQPSYVMLYPTTPAILERADLALVTPDAFVVPIGEERRIKIDEVHGLRFQPAKNLQIVTEYEFVHFDFPLFY